MVESDETWIGGRARGVGKGKGWVNKVHVFAMVERGGNLPLDADGLCHRLQPQGGDG